MSALPVAPLTRTNVLEINTARKERRPELYAKMELTEMQLARPVRVIAPLAQAASTAIRVTFWATVPAATSVRVDKVAPLPMSTPPYLPTLLPCCTTCSPSTEGLATQDTTAPRGLLIQSPAPTERYELMHTASHSMIAAHVHSDIYVQWEIQFQ